MPTQSQEMPIFTRSDDLIVWLLQVTRHFPRVHRYDFTKRLLDAAFDMRERLQQADEALALLRLHPHAQPQPVREGFGFLGFRLFAARRRLKPSKGHHYQRRLATMLAQYVKGCLLESAVKASVMAWNNPLRYANTIGLRKTLFANLPQPWTAAWRLPLMERKHHAGPL